MLLGRMNDRVPVRPALYLTAPYRDLPGHRQSARLARKTLRPGARGSATQEPISQLEILDRPSNDLGVNRSTHHYR